MHRLRPRVWVQAILLLLLPMAGMAQKHIATEAHAWVTYQGNHRFSDHWGLHTEYQWRRNNMFEHWQQSLLRVGVEYYLKNGLQFTVGYGWIRTFPYGDQPVAFTFDEHRLWEQVMLNQQVWRISINHRYRMEQRWMELHRTNADGGTDVIYQLRNRGRYRLMLTVPLSRSTLADHTLFLGLYDEIFLGFGPHIGNNVLDQNRAYAALGYRFNKDLNFQVGYLNQYVIKADGFHAERNHTLQLAVQYNIDLRKN
jgi:hypothetical protein